MAISLHAASTWSVVTADSSAIAIPGTPAAGDRVYIFAAWKAFDTTVTVAGYAEVTEFADGSVAASSGLGSMKVGAWYRDWQSGDGNPTIDFSVSPVPGAYCIQVWRKASTETWDAPTFVTAAIAAVDPFSATSSSTITIPDGCVVMELVGLRDDSATMTRSATTALEDDGSPNVTWNGNVVESPGTHASTTTSNDMAADLIHRFVTTGAAGVNLTATGDTSAAETGAALWVVQGVTAIPTGDFATQVSVTETDTEQASFNDVNPFDFVIDLPASGIEAGMLLIAYVATAPALVIELANNIEFSTPSGWEVLESRTYIDGTTTHVGATIKFARIATGSEDGTQITTQITTNDPTAATFCGAVAQVHVFTDWYGDISDGVAVGTPALETGAAGTQAPDPPNLSPPWGAADTVWIADYAAGNDNAAVDAYPTHYTGGVATSIASPTVSNAAPSLGTAIRSLNTASENPGAFDISTDEQWTANTVAIRPAEAAAGFTPRLTLLGVG